MNPRFNNRLSWIVLVLMSIVVLAYIVRAILRGI